MSVSERGLRALLEETIERCIGPQLRSLGHLAGGGSRALGPWDYRGHADQPFGAVTYSQFGEDQILANLFQLVGIRQPSFLDIGAHHPVNCNNTALFYSRGSRGLNVDANDRVCAQYAELRPEDRTLNVGVGAAPGIMDFYMIDAMSGRNSFDRASAEAFVRANPAFRIQQIRKIPVVTLDHLIAEHCDGIWPDLLSLDAEGCDLAILQACAIGPLHGPAAVCVEVVSGDDQDASASLAGLMAERAYRRFGRTVGNAIYVRDDLAGAV